MALDDYNFIFYHPEIIRHIERHFLGSGVTGSRFREDVFRGAREVIDFATSHIQGYCDQRIVVELDMPYIVGFDGLVHLRDLPTDVEVIQERRDSGDCPVYVVTGISRKPTNHIVIIAGPLGNELHGFYSIYPGKYAPPVPISEFRLRELGYTYDKLAKALQDNIENAAFWNGHALIKD